MSRKWRIERKQLHKFQSAAMCAAKRHREVCGLLVHFDGALCLVPVRNSSHEMGSFETTYRNRLISMRRHNYSSARIVGNYHSHPLSPPIPGRSDIDGSWDGALMLIGSAWDRSIRLWRIKRGRAISCVILRS
jgi:proteasome lid subunit RPN8/RPN11